MPRLGVCSWSLRSSSPVELAARVERCGVRHVQLALDPIRTGAWSESVTVRVLREAGIGVVSGMMATVGEDYSSLERIRETGGVRPDEHWEANLSAARANAALAERMGIRLVTLHAGFLPEDETEALYERMVERIGAIAEVFDRHGVVLGLETGQERDETLVRMLRAVGRSNVRVNFDPANMVLYAMAHPVSALRVLSPWVAQVHIKDAVATREPGTWGTEVAVGSSPHGVDWETLLGVVRSALPGVDLMIERESGETRVEDVARAAGFIRARCPHVDDDTLRG